MYRWLVNRVGERLMTVGSGLYGVSLSVCRPLVTSHLCIAGVVRWFGELPRRCKDWLNVRG